MPILEYVKPARASWVRITEPPDAWLPLWVRPRAAGTLGDMADVVLHVVEDIVSSPWIYLVLFAIAAIDGFFPIVPSEASILTAGVFAASGETSAAARHPRCRAGRLRR